MLWTSLFVVFVLIFFASLQTHLPTKISNKIKCFDSSSNLIICDYSNHLVRIIKNGRCETLAGSGQPESVDGYHTNAKFNCPFGAAITKDDILYVSESNAIRLINVSTKMVSTVAGDGTKAFSDGFG